MTSIREWAKDGRCVLHDWRVDYKDDSWQMGYLGYGGDTVSLCRCGQSGAGWQALNHRGICQGVARGH